MAIAVYSVGVTTTGSTGAATGSGTLKIPVTGHLEWIYLDYTGAHANTDVTISDAHTPTGATLLTVSNNNSDALYRVRATAVDSSNGAITYSHMRYAITGDLTVSVAQSDAATNCVTAYAAIDTHGG